MTVKDPRAEREVMAVRRPSTALLRVSAPPRQRSSASCSQSRLRAQAELQSHAIAVDRRQLAQVLTAKREFRQCANCSKHFEVALALRAGASDVSSVNVNCRTQRFAGRRHRREASATRACCLTGCGKTHLRGAFYTRPMINLKVFKGWFCL